MRSSDFVFFYFGVEERTGCGCDRRLQFPMWYTVMRHFPLFFGVAVRIALHCMHGDGDRFFFFFSFTSQLLVYDVRIFVGILGSYGSPIKRDGMGIAGIVVVF